MSHGYVKLYRKLKESPIFQDSLLLHIWMYCLLEAAHIGHKTLFGRREVFLQPGEFITGRAKAAMITGLTEMQVRAGLKALQNMGMVKLCTSQGQVGTIVSVCNWSDYQNCCNEKREVVTKSEPSYNQVTTKLQPLHKNDKNRENGKKEQTDARENENCDLPVYPDESPEELPLITPQLQEEAFRIFGGPAGGVLLDMVRVFGELEVIDALHAAEASKPGGTIHPNYIRSILQRWRRDGKPEGTGYVGQRVGGSDCRTQGEEKVVRPKDVLTLY